MESKTQPLISRSVMALLGVGVPLLLFLLLSSHVWRQGKGFLWDVPLLQWIHTAANPLLDRVAHTLTPLGVFWGVMPLSIVIGGVLLYRRRWRSLAYLVLTLCGSAVLNRSLKLLFQRARPNVWAVLKPDLSYAFPSGHAMSSLSLVLVLIVLTWNTRWRWPVIISGGLFVITIGWTRLYLGKHYPSDVLAGWLLAIAWAIGLVLVLRPQAIADAPSHNLAESNITQSEPHSSPAEL